MSAAGRGGGAGRRGRGGGPGGGCLRRGGEGRRDVGVGDDARGCEFGGERGRGGGVGVDEQHGDDVRGVGVEPGFYLGQPGRETACVEEVAGGVAEVPFAGAGGGG